MMNDSAIFVEEKTETMNLPNRLYANLCLMLTGVTMLAQPAFQHERQQDRVREQLNRGVVAFPDGKGNVCVSWRMLGSDQPEAAFDIYRNGEKLNQEPLTKGGTFFTDSQPLDAEATYEVRLTNGGAVPTGSYTVRKDAPAGYLTIPLNIPPGGKSPDGREYRYEANDASIGDVDGDGQYEVFLKWSPTNAHDNAHTGYTGNTLIDCYTLEGKQLWRIDLGQNIRSGAHYTQLMVYDFDGDGRAEMMCKTADGTTDGTGTVIGDGEKDWRCHEPNRRLGRIVEGPEYLTVFEGLTGKALQTVDYLPARGDIKSWGDDYANRCDRFLAGVGYFDRKASAVFCRGYYTRTVIAAWDWDGKQLTSRWVFDTNQKEWKSYAGQGNHNLRIADVDGDGYDEITYGSMAVDHDGRGLYNTGMGHGDAIHLMPFSPDNPALLVWDCHENKRDGVELRDARTGKVIFQIHDKNDVGRCMAADIDPRNPGVEMWSLISRLYYNTKGEPVGEFKGRRWSINSCIWWDGDLLRELLDHGSVMKFNWQESQLEVMKTFEGCRFNNWTKSNPCLSADIMGDWREEVLVRTADNSELRLYISDIPTAHRITCLEEDMPYRLSVATENVGYNQPPETGFYLGER